MTKEETAARLFEIVRGMTPASAESRRELANLSARIVRREDLTGPEILDALMAAGRNLDPLDVMTRMDLDGLFRDIAGGKVETKPIRNLNDPISVTWQTGRLDIDPVGFFYSPKTTPAHLKQVAALAEIDREETLSALRAWLENALAAAKLRKDKNESARLSSLLEAIGPAPAKKTAAARAAARIIKSCPLEKYAGAFTAGGKQIISDGVRVLRFYKPLDLPEAAEPLAAAEGALESAAKNPYPLPLPAVKELKALLKIAKANTGSRWTEDIYRAGDGKFTAYLYDFGPGRPAVQVNFLLDMLEALPRCKAYYSAEKSAVYFSARNGDGVIMPFTKSGFDYTGRRVKYAA